MTKLKKLIAPTDLSKLSSAGVRYALEIGLEQGCEIIVYHVIDAGDDWFGGDDELNPASALLPQQRQRLSEFLKETCGDLVGKVKVQQVVELGIPYRKIVEKAEAERADLIVISTHGRTGIDYMLVGSVTQKVVARLMSGFIDPTCRLPVEAKRLEESLSTSDVSHESCFADLVKTHNRPVFALSL